MNNSALPAYGLVVESQSVGGPDSLIVTERPLPAPRAGELLIKVTCPIF
ncbi:MAG: hypothetical protein ACRYG5_10785 [Janthinobacterium lividum]